MAHNFDLFKKTTAAISNHLISEHTTFSASMFSAQSNFSFGNIKIAVLSLDEGHLEIQADYYKLDSMRVENETDIPEMLTWIFGESLPDETPKIRPMCDICGMVDFGTRLDLIACGWTFGGGQEICSNHI